MDFIITSVRTSHRGLHHILKVTCVCTRVLFSSDRELWEHCLSMHLPRNHRRKMKQEGAGDVQLAVNDMSSQWGNNFPIHQSSSAHASPVFHFLHCCLLWGGITRTGEGID